jgi:hypothetical protein
MVVDARDLGGNMKTMNDLVTEAIQVQDACNLSGVVLSMGQAILALRELLPNASTGDINTHPVMLAWSSKISDLTGNYHASYPAQQFADFRALGYFTKSALEVSR